MYQHQECDLALAKEANNYYSSLLLGTAKVVYNSTVRNSFSFTSIFV